MGGRRFVGRQVPGPTKSSVNIVGGGSERRRAGALEQAGDCRIDLGLLVAARRYGATGLGCAATKRRPRGRLRPHQFRQNVVVEDDQPLEPWRSQLSVHRRVRPRGRRPRRAAQNAGRDCRSARLGSGRSGLVHHGFAKGIDRISASIDRPCRAARTRSRLFNFRIDIADRKRRHSSIRSLHALYAMHAQAARESRFRFHGIDQVRGLRCTAVPAASAGRQDRVPGAGRDESVAAGSRIS